MGLSSTCGPDRPEWPFQLDDDTAHQLGLVSFVPCGGGYGPTDLITSEQAIIPVGASPNGLSTGQLPPRLGNRCLRVDGVNGSLYTVSHRPAYNLRTFTVAAIVRAGGALALDTAWARAVNSFTAGMWTLGANNSNQWRFHISFTTGGQKDCTDTTTTPSTTESTFLVGTYDGTTMRLYVNGIQKATNTVSEATVDVTQVLSIGGRSDNTAGSSSLWNGDLIEGLLSNRVWSAQEAWEYYDPDTRWDRYWVPSTRVFFTIPSAATQSNAPRYLHYAKQRAA